MLRSLLLTLPTLLVLPQLAAAEEQWFEGQGSTAPSASTGPQYAPSREAPEASHATGLGMGLRLGYGIPFGKLADVEDADFDDFAGGEVLTQFDLTYAFTPNIVAGAYFGLNFGILPEYARDDCDYENLDCSLLFLTTGLAMEYRILPGKVANPWVGANLGLEWALQSVGDQYEDASMSLFGLAFGGSTGVDFELGRWGLGPFLSLQAGRFMSVDTDVGGSADIEERAFHYWLQLGARARYTFAR